MLGRKTFCVVTGASRGLGRCIAEGIAPKLGAGSVLAIMARTGDALEEVKQRLEKSYPKIRIHVTVVDLGTDDQGWFATIFQKIVQETGSGIRDFEQALLINNAGSVGDPSKFALDHLDTSWLNYYVSMNFTSMVMLTTHFLKLFSRQNTPHRCAVNISSLAAVIPVRSIAMYCSVKAARLMFYNVLAAEEPDVRVLSYEPGSVDTELQRDLIMNSWDDNIRLRGPDWDKVAPVVSAGKFLSILDEDAYQSGEHGCFDPDFYLHDVFK